MAIRLEKNGTYTVDVSLGYLKDGKRKRIQKKGFRTLKEAQNFNSDIRKIVLNKNEVTSWQ